MCTAQRLGPGPKHREPTLATFLRHQVTSAWRYILASLDVG